MLKNRYPKENTNTIYSIFFTGLDDRGLEAQQMSGGLYGHRSNSSASSSPPATSGSTGQTGLVVPQPINAAKGGQGAGHGQGASGNGGPGHIHHSHPSNGSSGRKYQCKMCPQVGKVGHYYSLFSVFLCNNVKNQQLRRWFSWALNVPVSATSGMALVVFCCILACLKSTEECAKITCSPPFGTGDLET